MAQSPAHRFGQIIGEVLEAGIVPLLQRFAQSHGLYLDMRGERPCRPGKNCRWVDLNGNAHDLDFVIERGGTEQVIGAPVAFIETAWRRYTKHSRNKAQEIQGAIEPLAETYRNSGPFKGAILAGVFTEGALTQLRSLGFRVLYFRYESVVQVFRSFGIDAAFDESTAERAFQKKISGYQKLAISEKSRLAAALVAEQQNDVQEFLESLAATVARRIKRIVILALHAQQHETTTVADAITFIERYSDNGKAKPIERYEIEIRYNNGDAIKGSFRDKIGAVDFLRNYQSRATP